MTTRSTSPSSDAKFNVCRFLRLPQLCSTCVAFSLVADMGNPRGAIGNWSMSFWCVCFTITFIIAIIECCRHPSHFLFFWYNISVTYACYAALICLSASIIYSITYLKEIFFYKHTLRALLKVLETFVAGVIFAFLSNTSLYLHQPALEWCVAMYSICFILAAVVLLLDLAEWEYIPFRPFSIFHALVFWLLYQFNEELSGHPQRSSDGDCRDELTYDMCTWDQRLAVAVLTAINLLVYVADLVYWARQVSVGTEG
ncbi:hypothetical protein FD755_019334 [Muntiacus reevesi]|uniref:MARVEL domain-containing protein n=1 Tax=Muntiacus reevesi TaxID=9886 RepID=A0A5N3X842_MUNRE|nr:hypothetical protein FD755_019334 [Muntiacus reevesi]